MIYGVLELLGFMKWIALVDSFAKMKGMDCFGFLQSLAMTVKMAGNRLNFVIARGVSLVVCVA